MGACQGFEHLEHTADVLIRARGRTLEEAFEYSVLGVYEVITNTSLVKPRRRIDVEVQGFDLENLLYRWIEEHLLYTDQEQLVFSMFRVCGIERDGDEWRIKSAAWGERFDTERHEHRTIVKAMTYAQMEIREEGGCWRVQFVVDI
ncbi:MAG: archease [Desulfurococcales archaeon]|nr:archease [Desulfurococcales archaeon]